MAYIGKGVIGVEHPSTSALTATSVTSTGAISGTTGTFSGVVTAGAGSIGMGPAFAARPSSGQSAPSADTFTKVAFGTETFDTDSKFASDRFTPTVAGYYQINGGVSYANANYSAAGAIIAIYKLTNSMSIEDLQGNYFAKNVQMYLWLAFFASFAVKIPMWPFHTWLPDAHVEAPTAGSVILAGVLLKMGGYGFIRFSLGMLPEASEYFSPLVMTLSIVAVVYTSLVALAQTDIKKLIAYSSVAHMGLVTIGIFIVNSQGLEGAMIQMISHGVVSGALFLCVGVIYDRMHTRDINFYGGLVNRMPIYATVFMIFMLGSVGLPGTSGFIGEFLVIVGAFKYSSIVVIGSATGIVLSAVYMLYLYKRIIFGEMSNEKLSEILDLNKREKTILIPLAIAVIFIGIFPNIFIEPMRLPLESIIFNYEFANAK